MSTPAPDEAQWVSGFEVIPYALPFREPYVTARGTLRQREMVLLRVRTSEGVTGCGDAVPLSLRGGQPLDHILGELQGLARDYAGARDEDERHKVLLHAFEDLSPPSECALHTAWLDMAGKAQDQPVWELLRPAPEPAPIECNATLSNGEPEQVAAEASRWAADGFTSFKLKLGLSDDVQQVEAVRRAVGPEAKLRIDVNGAWSPPQAVSNIKRMEEAGIELVEQPCPTIEELAQVRLQVETPIVADESISTREDAERAVAAQACDYATIKLPKVGGHFRVLEIASMISSYLSSALDGPMGIAAAAYAAQEMYWLAEGTRYDDDYEGPRDPGVAHGLATQRLFSETIASRQCELRDGYLHLPDGPGFGVEIDDAALERHRL